MPQKSIDIICDLRNFNEDIDDIGGVEALWQQFNRQMVGFNVRNGAKLDIVSPQTSGEILTLWILETNGLDHISSDTEFNIVDVLRNPALIYQCRVCGKYGPLRCPRCEDEERPSRICSQDAYFIEDELTAYCPDHIPPCNCTNTCTENAVFRCQRCHKLYGKHFRQAAPKNPDQEYDVYYCNRCYAVLFERCDVCSKAKVVRLGKSKCAYQSISSDERCGVSLCWEHSYQWKIWGPHNRGVTLCEYHKRSLSNADPRDILYTVLSARAPFAVRGKRQSLPNPFRLRRMINRHRTIPLSFDQLNSALVNLDLLSEKMGSQARRNFDFMTRSFRENILGIDNIEQTLLVQIREFYRGQIGYDAANSVISVEISDRYYKPGQPPRYRVQVKLGTTEKGRFIGSRGAIINQLKSLLNIEVDLL